MPIPHNLWRVDLSILGNYNCVLFWCGYTHYSNVFSDSFSVLMWPSTGCASKKTLPGLTNLRFCEELMFCRLLLSHLKVIAATYAPPCLFKLLSDFSSCFWIQHHVWQSSPQLQATPVYKHYNNRQIEWWCKYKIKLCLKSNKHNYIMRTHVLVLWTIH